jgi:endogenous inhibitor of DNA gyrase (YacG/DUF329 family)
MKYVFCPECGKRAGRSSEDLLRYFCRNKECKTSRFEVELNDADTKKA